MRAKRAAQPPDSPPKDTSRKRKAAGASAAQSESQQTINEAAEDAQAEQHMVDNEQSAGGGAPKAGPPGKKLPDGLLERRLEMADKEKGELAARVAQLEARLKDRDAEAAAKPAPSPKVMHTFCFSKFNLQKNCNTAFNRLQNRVESIRHNHRPPLRCTVTLRTM